MRFPNLFLAGAAKSGTSSLHAMLNQHRDIFMSQPKEPHFFARKSESAKQVEDYQQLFREGEGLPYCGESSTGYFVFPDVPERIRECAPEPRFLFLLRNPVDRTWSHYTWLRGLGLEARSFRSAVLADMDETPDPANAWRGTYRYYVAHSSYGRQVARYVSTFGRDRIHILTAESLHHDPQRALDGCIRFLGLSEQQQEAAGGPVMMNASMSSMLPGLFNRYGSLRYSPRVANRIKGLPSAAKFVVRCSDSAVQRTLAPKPMSPSRRPVAALRATDRQWLAELFSDSVAQVRDLAGEPFHEWDLDFPTAAG